MISLSSVRVFEAFTLVICSPFDFPAICVAITWGRSNAASRCDHLFPFLAFQAFPVAIEGVEELIIARGISKLLPLSSGTVHSSKYF